MTLLQLFIALLKQQKYICTRKAIKDKNDLQDLFNAYFESFDYLSLNIYLDDLEIYISKHQDLSIQTVINDLKKLDELDLQDKNI